MELILEPAVDSVDGKKRGENNGKYPQRLPENIPESGLTPQHEEDVPVTEHSMQKPAKVRRRWSLQFVDPIFYFTFLLLFSLLVVGLFFLITYNNRLIAAHLNGIEASNKMINEKITTARLGVDVEPPLISEAPTQKVPLLKPSLMEKEPTGVVQSKIANNPESLPDSTVKHESPAASTAEIIELRRLLSVKTQQVDFLALENHELRLKLEFGQSEFQDNTDVVPVEAVVHDDAALELSHRIESAVTDLSEPVPLQTEVQPTRVVDVSELISRASDAFIDRNYVAAGKWYNMAVQQDPDSRQANHGVASVALATGNSELAIDRYRHLLHSNPDDQSAFDAMLRLAASDNMIETELLSHVVRHSADPVPLYSMLGHYFARGNRWEQANAAFSNAIEGTSTMPTAEILFNLAVSFEHLGSAAGAVKYYQQALDAGNNTDLDRTLVLSRLDELKK